MRNHRPKVIQNSLFLLIGLLLIFSATAAVAEPVRVAILPFDMHAEKDLTFLQEGILDMLGSRLAYRDQVVVIDEKETRSALASVKGFEDQSRALLVGGKLKADYVLFGSLTVFGDSVSIDAKMADVSGQQPPLPFFAQTSGMGEVIPQINRFATDINATVFGRGVPQRPAVAAAPTVAAPATQAQPAPPVQDPRMHPEKLLQSASAPETPVQAAGQPYQAPNPAFKATAPAAGISSGGPAFWKSHNFKVLITGIDIADVDNDGLQELVMVSEKMVSIYQFQNGRLVKKAETAKTRSASYISVDAVDVNGNGVPEIYVTGLGPGRTTVASFVLEFNGTQYATVGKPGNWFYRALTTPDRGAVLLGQRQRAADESVFSGAIHEMSWQGDTIVPGRRLLKGGKTNLMGVTYSDVTQTGQSLITGYTSSDKLVIFNPTGKKIWEESERTGGNMTFFLLPKIDFGEPNKQFFPLRVRSADIDRDGHPEILVALHAELARNMLKDFRSFKKAQIECREWNGLGLASKWQTQEFQGRAGDFVVGDFDNDGTDELVVAVVAKEGAVVLTDAISSVIAFDLNPQENLN